MIKFIVRRWKKVAMAIVIAAALWAAFLLGSQSGNNSKTEYGRWKVDCAAYEVLGRFAKYDGENDLAPWRREFRDEDTITGAHERLLSFASTVVNYTKLAKSERAAIADQLDEAIGRAAKVAEAAEKLAKISEILAEPPATQTPVVYQSRYRLQGSY
jgi:hypothetical protein